MKITTDILKVALEWVEKNWLEVEGYNLTMTKVAKSRPPVWAEQLIKDVADLKEFVVEQKAFNVQQLLFNEQVLKFMEEQREFNKRIENDIKEIKSCPTIAKEIAEMKKQAII